MNYTSNLPSIKDEQWKYTNLARFYRDTRAKSEHTISPIVTDTNLLEVQLTDGYLSDPIVLQGLVIRPAKQAEVSEFKQKNGYFSDGFISNLASDAQYITLEQNSPCPPLKISHQFSSNSYVNLVLLFKNADNLTIFQRLTEGEDSDIFMHYWAPLSQNRKLEHVIIQNLAENAKVQIESHNELKRDAEYSEVFLSQGALLSRLNTATRLEEENATCHVHGLYLGSKKSHHDICSYIEHAAPHSFSHQSYKGILKDNAKGIFAGKVKVNQNCPLIEAQQLNKNLLLSREAVAYSRPQMEIDTDDVKCSHGSTIGQLSEKELFYFESRGIRKELAQKMLSDGFAKDVLLKIKSPQIREEVLKEIL